MNISNGFEHVRFVDSMWPLGAHGEPRVRGGALELKTCLWGGPGGAEMKGSSPRGLSKLEISVLGYLWFYTMRSKPCKCICFTAFQKQILFKMMPTWIFRKAQGGMAPTRLFGALARSQAALRTLVQVGAVRGAPGGQE